MTGLIAAAGVTIPTLIVALLAPAPDDDDVAGAGRAAGGQDSAQHGRGDPDQCAAAQKIPAIDVTRDELVDDVIPDF